MADAELEQTWVRVGGRWVPLPHRMPHLSPKQELLVDRHPRPWRHDHREEAVYDADGGLVMSTGDGASWLVDETVVDLMVMAVNTQYPNREALEG